MNEKKRTSLKTSLEMVETFKELLIAVNEYQKSTAKIIDIMEERLEHRKKANKELSKEISQLNHSFKNMSEGGEKDREGGGGEDVEGLSRRKKSSSRQTLNFTSRPDFPETKHLRADFEDIGSMNSFGFVLLEEENTGSMIASFCIFVISINFGIFFRILQSLLINT